MKSDKEVLFAFRASAVLERLRQCSEAIHLAVELIEELATERMHRRPSRKSISKDLPQEAFGRSEE
jgi:hypothetical protein